MCRRCAEGPAQGSRISAATGGPGGSDGQAGSGGAAEPGQVGQPGSSGRAAVLLDSVSPYGSRRVMVEYDGTTTSAYLRDKSGAIAATWIANHQPAPDTVDLARLRTGATPEMPAEHTKHPDGRPPLEA